MLLYILLRGKDFSLPEGASSAVIGLFFGVVCGLFYYQNYYRPYYWWFSLVGGLVLTYLTRAAFTLFPNVDPTSLTYTLASFITPFFLTLALNQYLSMIRKRKRKSRRHKKTHSHFFDLVNPQDVFKPQDGFKDHSREDDAVPISRKESESK